MGLCSSYVTHTNSYQITPFWSNTANVDTSQLKINSTFRFRKISEQSQSIFIFFVFLIDWICCPSWFFKGMGKVLVIIRRQPVPLFLHFKGNRRNLPVMLRSNSCTIPTFLMHLEQLPLPLASGNYKPARVDTSRILEKRSVAKLLCKLHKNFKRNTIIILNKISTPRVLCANLHLCNQTIFRQI